VIDKHADYGPLAWMIGGALDPRLVEENHVLPAPERAQQEPPKGWADLEFDNDPSYAISELINRNAVTP
jgi:hypothetical protein